MSPMVSSAMHQKWCSYKERYRGGAFMDSDKVQYCPFDGAIPQAAQLQALDIFKGLPLVFIPNCGQAPPKVSYYAESARRKVFFTPEEVVFAEAYLDEEEQMVNGF